MAFSLRELSQLAYANGFTLWHYKASDALARVCAKGFFAVAADLIKPGDMALISAPDGGRLAIFSGSGKSISLAPLA